MHIYRLSLFLMLFFVLTGCDNANLKDQKALLKTNCDTNQRCIYNTGVKVWLSDKNITPETPFSIYLDLPAHLKIDNAKLESITMYMGFIPQKFTKEATIYKSDTMVGICSEKNMLWQLMLNLSNVQTGDQITHFYNFYVTY
ncbi:MULTISPECIES: hypothetical protein [Pseudoalteromonas]|uniref:hypothetical protein n=1 Tax=Pseudoalteromonas TaxID=53246 RepID=UPI0002CB34CB|nr:MULTISPECIES: hypothetical protein [Pseudoalteromonas]ENN97740.1 hypothetical protein J139_15982 [Pseudoalteromonas agarivorans S816]MDI3246970.1 hypothetical protein [Pseudoalteromonas agarivorans]TMS64919.1 hypothetical protein CWB83_15045 [Pseudoalteromonas sp. S1691]TMS66975.1 hypothetical protein CWB86_16525 [Pseudoalteromonas sp. S1731]TMS70557.1 hypothetical protein CWB88_17935 [Pseudoalteromonas sp. S1941]